MDEKQYNGLMDKLDKILRLEAIQVVKGLSREQDKIELLDSVGFKPIEIDRMLGKSVGYSSVALYQMKKKKQPKTSNATTAAASPSSDTTPSNTTIPTTEAVDA